MLKLIKSQINKLIQKNDITIGFSDILKLDQLILDNLTADKQ